MKLTIGLFLVMLIINSTLSLPAGNPNDDTETLNTRTNISENSSQDDVDDNFKNFQGVVDTGVGDPYYSYTLNPLNFLEYFQDTLRRIRDGIERKVWTQTGLDSEEDPSSKRNSTSIVEVIDGHKVEINETVYSNNNNGHAVFKVRVIQVRPLDLDDNLTSEIPNLENESNIKKSTDDENHQIDNEINKNLSSPEESIILHDSTSEYTSYSTTPEALPYLNYNENDKLFDEINLANSNETTEEKPKEKRLEYLKENENLEESTTNDRESLESESIEEHRNDSFDNEWETLENNNNDINDEFDIFSPVQIDLSNDIFVNEMLADERATQNPDAEIFSDIEINYNPNSPEILNTMTLADYILPEQINISSTNTK